MLVLYAAEGQGLYKPMPASQLSEQQLAVPLTGIESVLSSGLCCNPPLGCCAGVASDRATHGIPIGRIYGQRGQGTPGCTLLAGYNGLSLGQQHTPAQGGTTTTVCRAPVPVGANSDKNKHMFQAASTGILAARGWL